jgi:hypothetical protein
MSTEELSDESEDRYPEEAPSEPPRESVNPCAEGKNEPSGDRSFNDSMYSDRTAHADERRAFAKTRAPRRISTHRHGKLQRTLTPSEVQKN